MLFPKNVIIWVMAKVKVQSVSAALSKARGQSNKYIREYGETLWMAALLTAYQGGGYAELKKNYNQVPMKYIKLLLDAYRYKSTELEFSMTRAASSPHLKKKDAQKYTQELADK